ncbi:hypothetical protein [Limnoglobus roseus]|uniref:Tetratricopeptide repeat protein n=1 Tax=Limnoglobus roseus TaxID=2598579 RepID=A0A5C1AGZ4_9BACT|nr:hypothetical protein [Limnoglobus roseus]QEL17256.1 hypothetical protein PX52LOC_04239 [Limnoglobus roseus]
MHAVRSLVVLFAAATVATAQAPATVPGAAVTFRVITVQWSETPSFVKLFSNSALLSSDLPAGKIDLPDVLKALESYRNATVTTFPKLTLLSGRPGEMKAGAERTVITGLDTKGDPKSEVVHDGTIVKVKADVTADRKTVEFDLDAKHTVVNTNVPQLAVTTLLSPTTDGGEMVPFTQFYDKADVQTGKHKSMFSLPAGRSRIIDLGTITAPAATKPTPTLARVPYLNRLFKEAKPVNEKYQVYLIATAEVVELSPATEFVADYKKAVAEGKLADAKALAEKALALDPACFAK